MTEPMSELQELLYDAIPLQIRIEEYRKNPGRSVYGEERDPATLPADEVARLAHFHQDDRVKLARLAHRIATLADWSVVAEQLEAEATELSREARRLYDERMAALAAVKEQVLVPIAPRVVDVELPFYDDAATPNPPAQTPKENNR